MFSKSTKNSNAFNTARNSKNNMLEQNSRFKESCEPPKQIEIVENSDVEPTTAQSRVYTLGSRI